MITKVHAASATKLVQVLSDHRQAGRLQRTGQPCRACTSLLQNTCNAWDTLESVLTQMNKVGSSSCLLLQMPVSPIQINYTSPSTPGPKPLAHPNPPLTLFLLQ